MDKKTILATCYAVNPYKGSEDAMGWNFVYQIAKFNNVIAITRENNKDSVEKFMIENPDEVYQNITFLYFDLPYWKRFWKKGSRGALLYFYLWQKNIVGFINNKNLKFDIAHNVNFHNDWTPSFLWKLKKPMVWGPVGHHPFIPKQYLQPYPISFYIKDRAIWFVKKMFWKFSNSLKKTVKKSNHIWCMNSSVASVLNAHSMQYSVYPSVATEDFSDGEKLPKKNFNILSVGRFVPLKGFDLTIHSFAKFINALSDNLKSQCKLILVGKGNQKKFYEGLISEYGLENYTEIIEWVDRKDLMKLYKESSVFLFPSHEGAGMVVAEALSFGLPVVCLKNEGPGEFIHEKCGFAIEKNDYKTTVDKLTEALHKLFLDKTLLLNMSFEARRLYDNRFSWEKRGEYLRNIYENIEV